VKVGEGGAPPRKEDWSRAGRFEDLMPHVQRFSIPFVDAKALIESTPEFWEYPMCDRDPLPHWSHGRVTLARRRRASDVSGRLERRLAGDPRRALPRRSAERIRSCRTALWAYERERLPMTAQIVQSNRSGGPEGVIDAVEQRAPDGFDNIDQRAVL
jgi:hypothetical protein